VLRFTVAVTLLLALLAQAPRDAHGQFLDKPKTPKDYWDRVKFEIDVGKFDIAGQWLKGYLAELAKMKEEDANKELVKTEEKDGMSAFLRLRQLPELVGETEEKQAQLIKDQKKRTAALARVQKDRAAFRSDVDKLIDRVTKAVRKELTDPTRIRKFIKNLNKTPEERAWAIKELQRSKEAAAPYLVEELQASAGRPEHQKILTAMVKLRDLDQPLRAALDINNIDLRKDLFYLFRERAQTNAIPYLWYLTRSEKADPAVRTRAAATIGQLQNKDPDKLTSAKVALTALAEHYYRHKERFPDPNAVTIWRYDAKKKELLSEVVTANRAEEYYGLRFARQALDLDPSYKPAQEVFLSLALDKAYGTDLDLKLFQKAPAVKELMATIRPDLVSEVLDRALTDHRLPVILGAVQTLGDLADTRAGHFPRRGEPVLVKALEYPDRRVQMAAAEAMLNVPGTHSSKAAARVVQVFRRMLLADATPKVLVAYYDQKKADNVGDVVKQAGYEPVIVRTRQDALTRLKGAADIDLILIDAGFPRSEREFPFVLAELRADKDVGLLPVLVTAPANREVNLRRLTDRYRHVWVVPENLTLAPGRLKETIAQRIQDSQGRPLSKKEREEYAETARFRLGQIAKGEYKGYEFQPAADAVYKALRSNQPDVVRDAIVMVGRFPGADAQRALAMIVLDPSRDKLRVPAAEQLTRHIQHNGLLLTNQQIRQIQTLYAETTNANLKAKVALVIGSMRPSAAATGKRLKDYKPEPPKGKE
jgi:CheY-like chemotaxis protein